MTILHSALHISFKKYIFYSLLSSFLLLPLKSYAAPPAPTLNGGNTENSAEDISHGQVVHLFWKKEEIYDKNAQTVTLTGGARAIRGDVTLDADILIGYLRPKTASKKTTHQENSPDTSSEPPNDGTQEDGGTELYRIEARGHVHIIHLQDQGWGDHGLYDMDTSTLLMTGDAMKFVTPKEIVTARDLIEYYPKTHISIARGTATVTTKDGKRITGDILESIGKDDKNKKASPPKETQEGQVQEKESALDRAYGWGHLIIRSANQTATGDRGVYLFDAQLARLVGHVHVTQGQNQNNGSQALVNMKTGISRMLPDGQSPIQGLVVPNEAGK